MWHWGGSCQSHEATSLGSPSYSRWFSLTSRFTVLLNLRIHHFLKLGFRGFCVPVMWYPSLCRLLVLPACAWQDSNVHGLVKGKEMDHSRDSFRNSIHFIVREQQLTPWKPIDCGLILAHYLGLDSEHSHTRVSLRKKHTRDMESADWSTATRAILELSVLTSRAWCAR